MQIGNRADARREQILTGEHADHARRRLGFARINRLQLAVRMIRAEKCSVKLTGNVDVVGIFTPPGDEPDILSRPDRLRNAELAHYATRLRTGSRSMPERGHPSYFRRINSPLAWSFGHTMTRLPFW